MIALETKRILITGGGGFLGSHIADVLRRSGSTQITVPRRKECDLTRSADVEQIFAAVRPEVVIHAAATTAGIGVQRDHPGQMFYENAIMGLHVIEACRVHRVEKTVIIGTSCSYPNTPPIPFQEDRLWDGYPEEITAPYGLAKRALIVQSQTYRKQYGMSSISLLPVNLYGPRDRFDPQDANVAAAMIRKFVDACAQDTPEVVLWGDGSPTREFLYVDDAAEAVVLAAERYDSSEPVNIGSGEEVSIRDLSLLISRLTGFAGRVVWDTTKPNGQPHRCLDVSRARKFGFQARTSLEAGLRRTIEWYREQARVTSSGS